MAVLRDPSSGRHVELELHNLIGRSANCHLRLEHPSISLEHASIRFGSDGWYARDLGSTNRTWLDGKALSEQAERLHAGSRLRFGGMEEEWRLVDETPPALIQPLPSGSALRVRHVPFTLPSTGPALASVCLDPNGNVVLERGRARQLFD